MIFLSRIIAVIFRVQSPKIKNFRPKIRPQKALLTVTVIGDQILWISSMARPNKGLSCSDYLNIVEGRSIVVDYILSVILSSL